MSDLTLFQAPISPELRARADAVQRKFRLSNTELLRVALEMACAKLEAIDDPLSGIVPDASTVRAAQ